MKNRTKLVEIIEEEVGLDDTYSKVGEKINDGSQNRKFCT